MYWCDSRGESFSCLGGQAHDLTARLSDDHLSFLLLPIVQVALKCHGVPGRIPYKCLNVRRPGIERRSVHEDGSRQVGMKRRSKEALMRIDGVGNCINERVFLSVQRAVCELLDGFG